MSSELPFSAHRWIAIGALLAAVAVLLGAYGAHGLTINKSSEIGLHRSGRSDVS